MCGSTEGGEEGRKEGRKKQWKGREGGGRKGEEGENGGKREGEGRKGREREGEIDGRKEEGSHMCQCVMQPRTQTHFHFIAPHSPCHDR